MEFAASLHRWFDNPTNAVQENGTYGGQGKAVGCAPPTALLFVVPRTLRRSPDLCILTWIKDADCDPVVGIMSRVRNRKRGFMAN